MFACGGSRRLWGLVVVNHQSYDSDSDSDSGADTDADARPHARRERDWPLDRRRA